jgi:hypothetical protein
MLARTNSLPHYAEAGARAALGLLPWLRTLRTDDDAQPAAESALQHPEWDAQRGAYVWGVQASRLQAQRVARARLNG